MSKFSGLALETEKPARLVITHPRTGEAIKSTEGSAYIDLFGVDSPAAIAQQRQAIRKRLNARGPATPEDIEEDRVELYAAVTAGWLLLRFDGTRIDLPCTPDNAKALYAEPGMRWLRDQVDRFIGDRGNFLPASPNA